MSAIRFLGRARLQARRLPWWLALLAGACLNPRPEELPSNDNPSPPGEPGLGAPAAGGAGTSGQQIPDNLEGERPGNNTSAPGAPLDAGLPDASAPDGGAPEGGATEAGSSPTDASDGAAPGDASRGPDATPGD